MLLIYHLIQGIFIFIFIFSGLATGAQSIIRFFFNHVQFHAMNVHMKMSIVQTRIGSHIINSAISFYRLRVEIILFTSPRGCLLYFIAVETYVGLSNRCFDGVQNIFRKKQNSF